MYCFLVLRRDMAMKDVIFKWSALLVLMQLGLAGPASGQKILDRCSLAIELDRLNVPRDEIPRWVTIASLLSDYKTDAISAKNGEGYRNYGIFQISDGWWCKSYTGGPKNICNVNCEDLRSDDIKASLDCAKIVRKVHGWDAWHVGDGYQISVDDCFTSQTSPVNVTAPEARAGRDVQPTVASCRKPEFL